LGVLVGTRIGDEDEEGMYLLFYLTLSFDVEKRIKVSLYSS